MPRLVVPASGAFLFYCRRAPAGGGTNFSTLIAAPASPWLFARLLLMPTFVVSMHLPESFDGDFIALIPRHRDFINRLLNEKIVETYAISSDRSRGWVIINGDDEAAVRAVVEQFPLYQYLHGVEIDELFIFDSVASRFPHINLN